MAFVDDSKSYVTAGGGARVEDYFALLKPRVMSLVIFTALTGMVIAPGHLHPLLAVASLLAIAVGAGAAGALNMWFDADIDRNRIAEALNVSVRTLNRAFEGKTNNVITTIRMVRLHKARDLVRGTDMPLEDIAFKLHYADAKHLSKKYQALFTRSPAQDRKISARRKKTPRVD